SGSTRALEVARTVWQAALPPKAVGRRGPNRCDGWRGLRARDGNLCSARGRGCAPTRRAASPEGLARIRRFAARQLKQKAATLIWGGRYNSIGNALLPRNQL